MGDDNKTLELMRRIMSKGVTTAVTESAREEFQQRTGLDLAEITEIKPDFPVEKTHDWNEAVLACIRYDPSKEPLLPDNVIVPCTWGCGNMVQHRPNHPDWLPKVCLECIADRPIKDHA